jgi:hypothetical protein
MAEKELDPRIESIMEDIFALAEALVPERIEEGEWLPDETERAIIEVQRRIVALLDDA